MAADGKNRSKKKNLLKNFPNHDDESNTSFLVRSSYEPDKESQFYMEEIPNYSYPDDSDEDRLAHSTDEEDSALLPNEELVADPQENVTSECASPEDGELLYYYLTGDITEDEKKRFEVHRLVCSYCEGEFKVMEWATGRMRENPDLFREAEELQEAHSSKENKILEAGS